MVRYATVARRLHTAKAQSLCLCHVVDETRDGPRNHLGYNFGYTRATNWAIGSRLAGF